MKPADAATIRGLSLAGMSGADIARRLGRSKQAVSKILNDAEMQHARDLARSVLAHHAADFAADFIQASRIAAQNGRHEAARDGLLAIRAIEPPQRAESKPGLTVKIGVMLPGLGAAALPADGDGQMTVTFPRALNSEDATG